MRSVSVALRLKDEDDSEPFCHSCALPGKVKDLAFNASSRNLFGRADRGNQRRGQIHNGQSPGYGGGLAAVMAQVLAVMLQIIATVFKAVAVGTNVVAWSVCEILLGSNKSDHGADGMAFLHTNRKYGRRRPRRAQPWTTPMPPCVDR